MKTQMPAENKRVAAPNVVDLQLQRQRRAARRMAMETIVLLSSFNYLYRTGR